MPPSPKNSYVAPPKVSFRISRTEVSHSSYDQNNRRSSFDDYDSVLRESKALLSNSSPLLSGSPTTSKGGNNNNNININAKTRVRGPVIRFGPEGGPDAEFARLRQIADLRTQKNREVFPPLRNPDYQMTQKNTVSSPISFAKAKQFSPPLPWSSFNTPKMREEEAVLAQQAEANNKSLLLMSSSSGKKGGGRNSSSKVTAFKVPKMKDVLEEARATGKQNVKKRKQAASAYQKQHADIFLNDQDKFKRQQRAEIDNIDLVFDTAQGELESRILDEVTRAKEEVRKEQEERWQERLRNEKGGRSGLAGANDNKNNNKSSVSVPTNNNSNNPEQAAAALFGSPKKSSVDDVRYMPVSAPTAVKDFLLDRVKDVIKNQGRYNNNNNNFAAGTPTPKKGRMLTAENSPFTKAHENNTKQELHQQQQQGKRSNSASPGRMMSSQMELKKQDERRMFEEAKKSSSSKQQGAGSFSRSKRRTFLTEAQMMAVANSPQSVVIDSPSSLLFKDERREGDDNNAADREYNRRVQGKTSKKNFFGRHDPDYSKSGGNSTNTTTPHYQNRHQLPGTPLSSQKLRQHLLQSNSNSNSNSDNTYNNETGFFVSPLPSRTSEYHQQTTTQSLNNDFATPSSSLKPIDHSSATIMTSNNANSSNPAKTRQEQLSPFARQSYRKSETEHAKLEKLAARLLSPEHLRRTIQKSIQDEDENSWFRDFTANVQIDDGGAAKELARQKELKRAKEIQERIDEKRRQKILKRQVREKQAEERRKQGMSGNDDEYFDDKEDEVLSSSATSSDEDEEQQQDSNNRNNNNSNTNAYTEYLNLDPEQDPDDDLKAYGNITSPERLRRMAARQLRENLDVSRDNVANGHTSYRAIDKSTKGLVSFFGGEDRSKGENYSLLSEDPFQWEANKDFQKQQKKKK